MYMDIEKHLRYLQLAGVNGNIYDVGPGTSRTKVRKKKGASRFFRGIPGTTNRISEENAGITVQNQRYAEIIFVRNLREKLRPSTLDVPGVHDRLLSFRNCPFLSETNS